MADNTAIARADETLATTKIEAMALSTQGKYRVAANRQPKCQACIEVLDDTTSNYPIYLNCGHTYCQDCLNALVLSGLSSRASFPPRCCDASGVDMGSLEPFLTDDVILRYSAVEQEYSERRPLFCASKTCSKFYPASRVPGQAGGKWLFCEDCHTETCLDCRQDRSVHTSDERAAGQKTKCPESLITTEDNELVQGAKWKQCPGCKNIVEKSEGCNHMDCDCGTEFCYICAEEYQIDNSCGCVTLPDEDGWHHRLDDDELRAHREAMDADGADEIDEEGEDDELNTNLDSEEDDHGEDDDDTDDHPAYIDQDHAENDMP